METSKYYIPTIEELSINQEVYLLDTGNYKAEYTKEDIYPILVTITELTDYPTIWVKTKGTSKGFKTYEIYPDQIGLRYLDQSDIESLGWIEDKSNSEPDRLNLEIIKDGYTYGIVLYDTIQVVIYKYKVKEEILFQGTIKNKSELIKLLKQIEYE